MGKGNIGDTQMICGRHSHNRPHPEEHTDNKKHHRQITIPREISCSGENMAHVLGGIRGGGVTLRL